MLPQGPLIRGPLHTSATLPSWSSRIRQPSPLVAVVPSRLGREPTTTQPVFSTAIAVVRPTPPGQPARSRGTDANNDMLRAPGSICTIVVPRPCRLPALLKLSTSTWSRTSRPLLTGDTTTA